MNSLHRAIKLKGLTLKILNITDLTPHSQNVHYWNVNMETNTGKSGLLKKNVDFASTLQYSYVYFAGISSDSTGEIIQCTIEGGLVCLNDDNAPIPCSDYKVRYQCTCDGKFSMRYNLAYCAYHVLVQLNFRRYYFFPINLNFSSIISTF